MELSYCTLIFSNTPVTRAQCQWSSINALYRVPLDGKTSCNQSFGIRNPVSESVAREGTSLMSVRYSSSNGESTKEESAWDLLQQLEAWHDRFPLAHPDMNPLPHVLLLLMTYHLVVIFILRPFYRSTSTPIPAQKCQQAAQSILYLLDVRFFASIS